jgi:hypothetical protein
LQLEVAIRDILTGESCGPQREIVEDRWQIISHIGILGDEKIIAGESRNSET